MRQYTMLIMVIILVIGCMQEETPINDTEAEAYAVYSALIGERFDEFVIVIKDHTAYDRAAREDLSGRLQWVKETMPAAQQETLNDFLANNEQSYPLKDFFDIRGTVILISEEKLRKIFQGEFDWLEFYVYYPFSQGIMTLSRVGFNAEMDQALVYTGNQSGSLSGAGYYVLLTKEEGNWTIQDDTIVWVS